MFADTRYLGCRRVTSYRLLYRLLYYVKSSKSRHKQITASTIFEALLLASYSTAAKIAHTNRFNRGSAVAGVEVISYITIVSIDELYLISGIEVGLEIR